MKADLYDDPVIHPPASSQVDMKDRKPLLWLPDGKALVRHIGFDTQTSGGRTTTATGPRP